MCRQIVIFAAKFSPFLEVNTYFYAILQKTVATLREKTALHILDIGIFFTKAGPEEKY